MWKFFVILAGIFGGGHQPVIEPPVFNGVQSLIIPKQCPVPHFQEQCLQDEIVRANAQQGLIALANMAKDENFAFYNSDHFKSYTDAEIQLMDQHVDPYVCTPDDFLTENGRVRQCAEGLRYLRSSEEEWAQKRARYKKRDPKYPFCGQKKRQQRARRMRNQNLAD